MLPSFALAFVPSPVGLVRLVYPHPLSPLFAGQLADLLFVLDALSTAVWKYANRIVHWHVKRARAFPKAGGTREQSTQANLNEKRDSRAVLLLSLELRFYERG